VRVDKWSQWYATDMPDRSRKRPRDPNQLGKLIVDLATGQAEDTRVDAGKDPAAVALGRKGGLKGGKARAAAMTADERSQAAQRAARARWEQKKQS
jgi:hypothetical protein